ncbi:MAG: DUF3656 domain-containing protein, partial [Lachnospiraceae bacterium]|nr:DUF3656 domain-containing protein [Lachnospiraceae bacterium]
KSTGYYHTQNGPSLITIGKPGYAGTDEALLKEIHDRYCRALPVREIGARVFLRVGEPAGLYLYDPADPSVCAYRTGDVVQKADKRPLTADEIRTKVTKTGGTPFVFTAFEIESDDDAFLPVSALGRLRRDALDAFWDELTEAARKRQKPEKPEKALRENGRPEGFASLSPADRIWAQVGTKEQYLAAIGTGIRHVILDAPAGSALYEALRKDAGFLSGDAAHYLAFPEIMRESHRSDYLEMLSLVRKERHLMAGVLARTAEHLRFLKEAGYDGTVVADAGIYTWNTRTLSVLSHYCDLQVFPHELSGAQLLSSFGEEAGSRFLLTVYGRQPMMVSAGCVRKTTGSCAHSGTSFWHLRDRMGEDFPVQCVCGKNGELCHNVVLNAHPLSLHNYLNDPLPQQAKGLRLLFTTESGSKTQQILSAYLSRLDGDAQGGSAVFRDMKFTTGHYLKSAL